MQRLGDKMPRSARVLRFTCAICAGAILRSSAAPWESEQGDVRVCFECFATILVNGRPVRVLIRSHRGDLTWVAKLDDTEQWIAGTHGGQTYTVDRGFVREIYGYAETGISC